MLNEQIGNKIFALETNLNTLHRRWASGDMENFPTIFDSMNRSLEQLKELKEKVAEIEQALDAASFDETIAHPKE